MSDMNAVGADRWRVFVSHTAELRNFPKPKSYVAEVERAISAAGHVVVDMSDFPAADQPPAEICVERVRGCDVYVGVLVPGMAPRCGICLECPTPSWSSTRLRRRRRTG
jgi:hypothetical protein